MCQGLLSALAKIAAPVIKAYHDDFRVHDAKVISALAPGDVILWAPREHGSHLIILARADRPNQSAAEHFAAVTDAPAWYLAGIATDGQSWTLAPAPDAADIVARWTERAARDTAPEPVKELHL